MTHFPTKMTALYAQYKFTYLLAYFLTFPSENTLRIVAVIQTKEYM